MSDVSASIAYGASKTTDVWGKLIDADGNLGCGHPDRVTIGVRQSG